MANFDFEWLLIQASMGSVKAKTELLEQTVLYGSYSQLEKIIAEYSPFEFNARAFYYACATGSLDKLRLMHQSGMSLEYDYSSYPSARKAVYQTAIKIKSKTYPYDYCVLLAATRLPYGVPFYSGYTLSDFYGLFYSEDFETASDDMLERVFAYLVENKVKGFDLSKLMYFAILWQNDRLKALLGRYNPPYWRECTESRGCYLGYGDLYSSLRAYEPSIAEKIIDELAEWADGSGAKLSPSLVLLKDFPRCFLRERVWERCCFRLQNKKQFICNVIDGGDMSTLKLLLDLGFAKRPKLRDELIDYATCKDNVEALAMLMEYKEKTADLVAEQAKADAKLWRELSMSPDSVTALKRLWSYKELDDGSLIITGYKGNELHVTVPQKIGKKAVSIIAEEAFSPDCRSRDKRYAESRDSVVSVTVSEGILKLESRVFYRCSNLEKITLPSTLKSVGFACFAHCPCLVEINLPDRLKFIGGNLFAGCHGLRRDGFIIFNNIMFDWADSGDEIIVPDSVKLIAEGAVSIGSMSSIIRRLKIPASVKCISKRAFERIQIEKIEIAEGVEKIGEYAFWLNPLMRDIYIPESVKKMNLAFGAANNGVMTANLHTLPDSQAEKYIRISHPKCKIYYDYSKGDR